jgi:hypothetical protein
MDDHFFYKGIFFYKKSVCIPVILLLKFLLSLAAAADVDITFDSKVVKLLLISVCVCVWMAWWWYGEISESDEGMTSLRAWFWCEWYIGAFYGTEWRRIGWIVIEIGQ